MKHKIKIPKPSAKRLEKDRRIVVEINSAFCSETKEFIIPEGVSTFEFEFEEWEHPDKDLVLDGDVYYRYFILYQNSTGTRQEKIEIMKRHPR